jgi:3-deoxy-7-phosphoheptulonate synthase
MHPRPQEALCDGGQALLPEGLRDLMRRLPPVLAAVDRELWRAPARRRTA